MALNYKPEPGTTILPSNHGASGVFSAPKERCGAHKHDGTLCRAWPVLGSNRCKFHGGANPKGIAASNFKDGRYSKYLPLGLLTQFNQAKSDEELLSLKDEIALMDTRVGDLLTQLDAQPPEERWEKVKLIVGSMRAAMSRNQVHQLAPLIDALDALALQGASQKETWQTIIQTVDERRKLVEGERKRLVEMQQVITAENAMVLVTALASAVKKHVTDRDTLTKISRELVLLTQGQPGTVVRPYQPPK